MPLWRSGAIIDADGLSVVDSEPRALGSQPGQPAPLGASLRDGGVNFSLYAADPAAVELCLFDAAGDGEPAVVVPLEGEAHRSGRYWHVWVEGLKPGQLYGYRVLPPEAAAAGVWCDPQQLLLDPYAQALAVPPGYQRDRGQRRSQERGWADAIKAVVADLNAYDWQGDRPLKRPARETIVYELHVKGFTAHPSSGVPQARAGTYAGLINKIPYLRDLGVTAVELLPVFQFDPQDAPAGLPNYWGYQPLSFLVPHHAYATGAQQGDPLAVLDEFRDMVKAFHQAGIEVILDVVFNHTAEADAEGPTFSYRGLSNRDYYLLDPDDPRQYIDDTGCRNTLNANNPVVRRLIRHSLRHWVEQFHIDGFRFDLASVLARDESGQPVPRPPILWDLDTDPVLSGTKLIAEAWDAAGLYQVGSFSGDRWQEWNGRFRDDVRRFLKGDNGQVVSLAQRLIGSPDIYGPKRREAEASINFITCHDGFTLADLVSYNGKHNEANGEDNRDGSSDNASWNCGVEGPSDDPAVQGLRQRQMRNFLTLLLLASGTPMLGMGDEMARSQGGNNNAYCQDNAISWLDWTLLEQHGDLHRFTKALIDYRRRRDLVVDSEALSLVDLLRRSQVSWHGVEPDQPDWGENSHALGLTFTSVGERFRLCVLLNAWWQPLTFKLPPADFGSQVWHRWIDTSLASPEDIVSWDTAPPLQQASMEVGPRALVALVTGHQAPG